MGRVLTWEPGKPPASSRTRELAGTPAAPEPMASRIRFYEDDELRRLALQADFVEAHAERPEHEGFAREAGLSEAEVAFFQATGGAQLLTARKPRPSPRLRVGSAGSQVHDERGDGGHQEDERHDEPGEEAAPGQDGGQRRRIEG